MCYSELPKTAALIQYEKFAKGANSKKLVELMSSAKTLLFSSSIFKNYPIFVTEKRPFSSAKKKR